MIYNSAKWLKVLFGVLLGGIAAIILLLFASDNLTEVVSEQLESLKKHKPKDAYYAYTSKAFQESAPLERFLDFIDTFPAFIHHQSIRFIDRNAEGERGSLQALLFTAPGIEIPVHYQLVKEEGSWKIDSISLDDRHSIHAIKNRQNTLANPFDSTPLKTTIQGLMQAIQKRELRKGYDIYSSKDFKLNTSFQEFEQFVRDNPSFSDYTSFKLNNLSFDNNIATFSGTLTTKDGTTYPVEYDLIEEEGAWKIFHIQISHSKNRNTQNSLFSKFLLGSSLDEDGTVISPTTMFKSNSGDIYLNIYVNHALPATTIDVVLKHVSSQSTLPPVSSRLTQGGTAKVTFIFSPPPHGWPIGQYKLLVSSSMGVNESVEFTVEE